MNITLDQFLNNKLTANYLLQKHTYQDKKINLTNNKTRLFDHVNTRFD